MQNVTDEVSNPFGMSPPCPHECDGGDGRRAVFGYGDANADFHAIGDHPGVHGGADTGIPFTGSPADRILDVLAETGFLTRENDEPRLDNCFLSYLYLCCVPDGEDPTAKQYADFERFFDAELRAITADVLLPVGERATEHVVGEYTARGHRIEVDMPRLHGEQIRGRGFLVMPIRDPADWDDGDFEAAVTAIEELLAMDYHQLVDLGRFLPGGDPYLVR